MNVGVCDLIKSLELREVVLGLEALVELRSEILLLKFNHVCFLKRSRTTCDEALVCGLERIFLFFLTFKLNHVSFDKHLVRVVIVIYRARDLYGAFH